MVCQNCQKRLANVHFTQIINNKKTEMYLCEQCAKEKGHINGETPLSISDFFTGLMSFGQPGAYINSTPVEQPVCEKCGMTYEDFQKLGKLGCDNCYSVFSDRLKPLLKRLHGNVEHTGKLPARVCNEIKTTREIDKLKEQLTKAVQSEDYEKAAELRDKIKSLDLSK